MTKPEILEQSPMNMAQVKDELGKIEKRDGELNFRAQKTVEHLKQLSILSKTKAAELEKKLTELAIPRMKDIHIHKIIDMLPTSVEDLKVILQGYTLTIKADNQKKIVELVKDYA